jgi:hypothetical protein
VTIRSIVSEWDIPDTDRVEIKPVRYRAGLECTMLEPRSLMEASERLHAFEEATRELLDDAVLDTEMDRIEIDNDHPALTKLRALVEGKIEEPKP